MKPLLSLAGVCFRRSDTQILEDVTFEVGEGETVALLGPSGSGKSTVLRLLLGLISPDSGTVSIGGTVASEGRRVVIPPEERGLAVVFQDLALWPHFTVAGNLRFVLRSQNAPREQEAGGIADMLRRVGLSGMEGRYPGELSGGEQQRVAIARALVSDPSAILFDEPLAGLDVELKHEMLGLFQTLIRERSATTVYVTHDPEDAGHLGARVLYLEQGRMVAPSAGTE